MRCLFIAGCFFFITACNNSTPSAKQENNTDNWTLTPFIKSDDVNPIMIPDSTSVFNCPVRKAPVKWEEKDVFNPAALVRHDTLFLLYRAEDKIGKYAGTSRIGLTWSTDGLHFKKNPDPVLYPDNDSLKKYEYPVLVHFDFDFKNSSSADIIYFNPMQGENYKTNPFNSIERHYPVEIPYLIDDTYLLTMDIPEGFQVDEMPKSARVNYNGNEGFFEYLIQKGESNIQMRVHLKLNRAFFPVEEYPTLRDFFAFVVKKESEQIVFKKMK